MTSTLPNLYKPAAVAADSKSISLAGVTPAGAAPAQAAGGFDELLPAAKKGAPQKPAEKFSAGASSIHAVRVAESDETAALAAADEKSADEKKTISRDTLEQAAAFAGMLMQALLPEVTVTLPTAGANGAPTVPAQQDKLAAGEAAQGGMDAISPETPIAAENTAPLAVAESFRVARGGDGAIEIKLALVDAQTDAKTGTGNAVANTQVEISAELELPGQAVMRLEASGTLQLDQSGRAIFAGKRNASPMAIDPGVTAGERNFELFGGEKLTTGLLSDGIAVAKTTATMATSTLDETRATNTPDISSSVPLAHGQFSVAWPTAEKTPEVAVSAADQNFAERAVATVTGLVEAQFSASMQKSGSVQLKLRFGGEDLSVRVELRDGVVHTNFRTDSAELRTALTLEMQKVANQSPEQLRRYVAPIFSPGSSSDSSSGSYPDSGRQASAQQDPGSQHRQARERQEEAAPFARRSLLRESFFPESVAPRTPALLPTSLRLSALA